MTGQFWEFGHDYDDCRTAKNMNMMNFNIGVFACALQIVERASSELQ
jgi:hypothetical protein